MFSMTLRSSGACRWFWPFSMRAIAACGQQEIDRFDGRPGCPCRKFNPSAEYAREAESCNALAPWSSFPSPPINEKSLRAARGAQSPTTRSPRLASRVISCSPGTIRGRPMLSIVPWAFMGLTESADGRLSRDGLDALMKLLVRRSGNVPTE
jgi:hypothetical protein